MPSSTVLLMIGGFVIGSGLVILGILIWFRYRQKKDILGIPSEEFEKLNYDEIVMKAREAMTNLSKNRKEVNEHAKENGKERTEDDKGGVRKEDSGNGKPNDGSPIPSEHVGLQQGSANTTKQDSTEHDEGGFVPSWRRT